MYKNILVRAPNWVGDAVMAAPALSALRAHFREATITLLAKPSIAAIFEHHPAIDRTILYEMSGKHAGPIGFLRLSASLQKEQFDMAILMKNAFESALLTALARIPVRIGYDTDYRAFLLTHSLSRKTMPIHQRDAYLKLSDFCGGGLHPLADGVAPLGRLNSTALSLVLTREEVCAVRKKLESCQIFPETFVVGIFPGTAKGSAKEWLPDRFAQVADNLAETFGGKTLILGGPNDLASGEAVLKNMKSEGFLLIKNVSLREMMAILSLCNVCITNDSGPLHIAAALGIPHVAIYGPRLPEFSFPGMAFSAYAYHRVPCSPCDFRVCPVAGHPCMTGVLVNEVFEKAKEVIYNYKVAQQES